MASTSNSDYAAFEEKVKRSVFIDNLSPQVTEAVLKKALEQFGDVNSVHFIPNYIIPDNIPQRAVVEMKDMKSAQKVMSTVTQFPFMICGMPRPVRARPAEMDMFPDKPAKPGRKIQCQWIDATNPDFETTKKLKQLVRKHAAEASFLLKKQLEEEESLAAKQQEVLRGNYKKYEMLDSLWVEKTVQPLARHYNMTNFRDH